MIHTANTIIHIANIVVWIVGAGALVFALVIGGFHLYDRIHDKRAKKES